MEPVTVYQVKANLIDPGTAITVEHFKPVTKHYGNFNDSDYVKDINSVVGMQVNYTMTNGDYLRHSKLTDNYNKGDLIRENMLPNEVEVSIDTDLSDAVGGEIKIGDRVNLTAIDRQANGKKYRSFTFLQNVLVSGFKNDQGESIGKYEETPQGSGIMPNTGYSNLKPSSVIVVVDQSLEAYVKSFDEITLSKCGPDYVPYEAEIVYNFFYEVDQNQVEDKPVNEFQDQSKGE
jgi:hypothetical protein